MSAALRRFVDEDGVVGGVEVLPFGLLIFVAGLLLIVNAWAVVDAELAAEAAAREAGRAYVEAPSPTAASGAARQAAAQAIAGSGRDPDRLDVDLDRATLGRCAVVVVETRYRVPVVSVPLVGGFGDGITVRGEHRETVDAFRAGLGTESSCG